MFFQDISDCLIRNLVTDVGQSALDPVITPIRILLRESYDQFDDLWSNSWPTDRFPLLAVVPLLRHEFPMPAEERVGRDNSGQLHQRLSANGFRFHGQQASLVIGQT